MRPSARTTALPSKGGNPKKLERSVRKRLSLHRIYLTPQQKPSAYASKAQWTINHRRLPLMSTKVPGSWEGRRSREAQSMAEATRQRVGNSVKGPVWLALHHEPRNDGDPSDWVAMQQHARDIVDRHAKNVVLVGILNGWDFLERGGRPGAYRMRVGNRR